MSCAKCGGKRLPSGSVSQLRPSTIGATDDGIFVTTWMQENHCSGRYSGPHGHRTIYVVARGTPDETFFTRANRGAAVQAARQGGHTLDAIPATSLCQELVETLHAS